MARQNGTVQGGSMRAIMHEARMLEEMANLSTDVSGKQHRRMGYPYQYRIDRIFKSGFGNSYRSIVRPRHFTDQITETNRQGTGDNANLDTVGRFDCMLFVPQTATGPH